MNIVYAMSNIHEIMKGCIEAEMVTDGFLSDVNTFHPVYVEESHIDEPYIWMYQHETIPSRQADISQTMELTTPFQFNCSVYERELEDAQTSTLNLATRVIRTISKNWQTVQNTVIPNTRLIRNVTLETFYPLGTVDVNNKSERLPVVGVVMNVNHIIDWRLCCKKGE
jgi:hypothetical protein